MSDLARRLERLATHAAPRAALPDLAQAVAYWVGAAITAVALEDTPTRAALGALAAYVAQRADAVPADALPHWQARPARRTIEYLAAADDATLRALVTRAHWAAEAAPGWRAIWDDAAALAAGALLCFPPRVRAALGLGDPPPHLTDQAAALARDLARAAGTPGGRPPDPASGEACPWPGGGPGGTA